MEYIGLFMIRQSKVDVVMLTCILSQRAAGECHDSLPASSPLGAMSAVSVFTS